jgi:hypothetical protein
MIWSNPLYITKGKDFVKPKLSYLERNKWKSGISFFLFPLQRGKSNFEILKTSFWHLLVQGSSIFNLFFLFFSLKNVSQKVDGAPQNVLFECGQITLKSFAKKKKKKILYSFLIFGFCFCAKTFNWLPNL